MPSQPRSQAWAKIIAASSMGDCPVYVLLQFRPHPSNAAHDSCDGRWRVGSPLGNERHGAVAGGFRGEANRKQKANGAHARWRVAVQKAPQRNAPQGPRRGDKTPQRGPPLQLTLARLVSGPPITKYDGVKLATSRNLRQSNGLLHPERRKVPHTPSA